MPSTTAPSARESSPAHPSATPADLRQIDAWWRAANYLSVGQIYLLDNPLLGNKETTAGLSARRRGAASADRAGVRLL